MAKSSIISINSIISRMMVIVCYYVVLTSLFLSLIEVHPTSGLPINHDISQDSKEATPSPIRRLIDLRTSDDDKRVDTVKSSSVSLTWRIRRSADTSGDPSATATPLEEEKISNRKRVSDIFRNSYHNRSGWGGGYGRRRR